MSKFDLKHDITLISRRRFLRKTTRCGVALAGLSSALPHQAEARLIRARELHEARDFLQTHFTADFHAHPSMKTGFFKKDFFADHPAPAGTWPFTLRTDAPSLRAGGVNAVLSALYVPEPGVSEDARLLSKAGHLVPGIRRMKKTFRQDPEQVAAELLSAFDSIIAAKPDEACVARSVREMDRISGSGKIAILHTLEGGHGLGGQPLSILPRLHARGVCMVTLAHFYDAGVAPNIQGVPKTWYLKASCSFRDQYASEDCHDGLPERGHEVVETMIDLGMLIDLTHATPEARAETMDHVGNRAPVVMSHVGCHCQAPFRMNPTPAEVRRIAEGGGVIGVIFLNYFLKGKQRGKGIGAIIENMACIMNHGGEDCVAWGSDFDGFTNPPNDLREPSDLPRLADKMLKRFGERATAKILGGNLRRVLEDGWKSPV